jgi:hypothetical protein
MRKLPGGVRFVYRLLIVALLLVVGTAFLIAALLVLVVVVYAIVLLAVIISPVSLFIMYMETVTAKDGDSFKKKASDYRRALGNLLRKPNLRRAIKTYRSDCNGLFGWLAGRHSWASIAAKQNWRKTP